MTTKDKFTFLKVIKILFLIVYIPALLFYSGVMIPEYIACLDCDYEGAMGTDIWGDEVQCFGESKAFANDFFKFTTMIIAVFSITLVVIFYLIYHLKKKLK